MDRTAKICWTVGRLTLLRPRTPARSSPAQRSTFASRGDPEPSRTRSRLRRARQRRRGWFARSSTLVLAAITAIYAISRRVVPEGPARAVRDPPQIRRQRAEGSRWGGCGVRWLLALRPTIPASERRYADSRKRQGHALRGVRGRLRGQPQLARVTRSTVRVQEPRIGRHRNPSVASIGLRATQSLPRFTVESRARGHPVEESWLTMPVCVYR